MKPSPAALLLLLAWAAAAAAQETPPPDERLAGAHFRGLWISKKQRTPAPPTGGDGTDYFKNLFALLREQQVDFLRASIYWEAYVGAPAQVLAELRAIAELADASDIRVLYDNHQWMVSSALPAGKSEGVGFPIEYVGPYASVPGTDEDRARAFWKDFWNRDIKHATRKTDMWTDMAAFMKTVVETVDGHRSTWGYQIINEPWAATSRDPRDSAAALPKMGAFNEFMVRELGAKTSKPLVFNVMFQSGTFQAEWERVIPGYDAALRKVADPTKCRNFVLDYHIYGAPPAGVKASLAKIQALANVIEGPTKGWWICGEYNVDPGEKLTEEAAVALGAVLRDHGARAVCFETLRAPSWKDWTRHLTEYDAKAGKRVLTKAGQLWIRSLQEFRRKP